MKKQITHISIRQTSKVIAVAYFWLGIIAAVVLLLVLLISGGEAGYALFMALFYIIFFPVVGYLGTALFAWVYNMAAAKVGGIEFQLHDVGESELEEV